MAIDLEDKPYSPSQITISTWDEATNRVRVDAEVTAVIGVLEVDIDAASDSIAIGNPSNSDTLLVNPDGSINITSTTLPLPTGASTSALQTTGNSSLSSIDTKTPALGQALAAASVPVVLTAAQLSTLTPLSSVTVSGSVTANAGTNLNTSLLALDSTVAKDSSLTTIDSSINTLLKPASTLAAVTSITNTVTIKADTAGNQANALKVDGTATTQPISVASLPLPTGASTSALQTTGNSSLSSIDGKIPSNLTVTSTRLLTDGSGVTQPISAASLPLPTGASTAAKQPALGTAGTASADVITIQGIASMTALVVDGSAVTQPISAASLPLPTGASTSALQTTGNTTLSTISGQLPTTLGAKTIANSMAVNIASDQMVPVKDVINVSGVYGNLTVGVTAVEIKVGGSPLANRKLVTLDNNSNATLYWGYDSSVTTTTFAGRIVKDQQASWSVGPSVSIFLIAVGAGNLTHISEGS